MHWSTARSVESLPDYPIGYCEIFQKDVAGELTGCAGRYYLSRNKDEWQGTIHEKDAPKDAPIELPDGAKIVSISEPVEGKDTIKVVYLLPDVK